MKRYAISKQKLSAQIATVLEDEIVTGQRPVGELLPSERSLMEQFGVGRPAVREALHSLHLMGLVEVGSGSRARVTEPTPEKILGGISGWVQSLLQQPQGQQHMQSARSFFEVGLARYAASHAEEADLERLEAALKANKEALDDLPAFLRTDIQFHYVIAEIPGNPIFPAIHNAFVEWLTDQRETTLQVPGQIRIAYRAHEQIYRAIGSGVADKAEKAMNAHLRQLYRVYRKVRARA